MYAKMSTKLLMNKFQLPTELIDIISEYVFPKVNRIPADDARYELLLNIPSRDYDESSGVAFVYMVINDDKDYFLTCTYEYGNAQLQLQTFFYGTEFVQQIEGHIIDF
jgi:hypothetical protein